MIVKEQIDFWNSLPEKEQNKEVTVCGLTVEEVMKLKIESENLKEENAELKHKLRDWDIWEEGRKKEIEQWKQEWQDAQIKANEEGFARTTLQIKYSELEKENAKLSNSVLEFSNSVIELTNSETELEKQIEKMKCCGNCKNNTEENCLKCSECYRQLEEKKEGWFDKWELAE